MAYCTNCGTQMSDEAGSCPQCGHPRALTGATGKRVEGNAVASLILGIVGLVMCPLVPSIIAVILGSQAKAKIAADPELDGEGLAKTGVILGWVGIGLAALGIIAVVAALALGVFSGGMDVQPDFDFNV